MSTSKLPFWSRPLAPIAMALGACLACSVVPLTAMVVGVSAAGTVAVFFAPLAGVLLAGAVVLAGVLYLRRRRLTAKPVIVPSSPAR